MRDFWFYPGSSRGCICTSPSHMTNILRVSLFGGYLFFSLYSLVRIGVYTYEDIISSITYLWHASRNRELFLGSGLSMSCLKEIVLC